MDCNLCNELTNTSPKEPSVLKFLDREIEESLDVRTPRGEIPEVPKVVTLPPPAKTSQRFAGWIRGYGMVYTLWPEPNPLSLEVSIEQKKIIK